MNPAKLKSYVDHESANPDVSHLVGMPQAPDDGSGEGDDDEEWDEEAPAAPADPMARGNELFGSWGEQGSALRETAGEVVDAAHDIGGDLLLGQVPEGAVDEVHEQFDRMPDEIKVCFAQLVAPLSDDDLTGLATALIDGHDGETENADVKLVAAYLKAAAAYAKDEVDPSDFVQDEDEDKEEDDKSDDDAEKPATADGESAAPVAAGSAPLV